MLAVAASVWQTIAIKTLEKITSSFKERKKELTGMAIYMESACKGMSREGNLEGVP